MPKAEARMRPADPYHADFHLLEVVSRPPACVNGSRIALWVYRDKSRIREIVLTGHAESGTCQRATACLIRAAESLDDEVPKMITCGAAYFRVPEDALPSQESGEGISPELEELRNSAGEFADLLQTPNASGNTRATHIQSVLARMIQEFRELAEETGLAEVYERPWSALEGFREEYARRVGSRSSLIFLPAEPESGQVANLLPIVPGDDPHGPPLVFALEGWDFDCPKYQMVAYRHLNCMRRELLRDALHRRQTYRSWLKEWMEDWVPRITWLPVDEALRIRVAVPGAAGSSPASEQWIDVSKFLSDHVAGFLDRGQTWHRALSAQLAGAMASGSFGRMDSVQLDRPIRPEVIIDVDYERGIKTQRRATQYDRTYTFRERIRHHDPHMISTCLTYIRRMDAIVQPYQDMDLRAGSDRKQATDGEQRKLRVLNELSRSIVLETMIRGWPSYFLDDDKDRENLDIWARQYRAHIWSIMAQQAEQAGVALELLLEDNIVYDVRFNDDLGCTIKPLMLVDDAVHAQVHGSGLGSSAAVPLWSRSTPNSMSADVMALGQTNSQRARELVERARRFCGEAEVDLQEASDCLRLALACHPAVAGQEILREWSRRLGRDTRGDFERARPVIEAATLCAKGRVHEVKPYIADYLAKEPDPLPDAYVMAALCQLPGRDVTEELRKRLLERNALVGPYNKSLEELQELGRNSLGGLREFGRNSTAADALLHLGLQRSAAGDFQKFEAKRHQLENLKSEIERLDAQIEALRQREDERIRQAKEWIEKALANPDQVRARNPALAKAAEAASDQLRAVLENGCQYHPNASEDFFFRYATICRLMQVNGLFGIVRQLAAIRQLIELSPQKAQTVSMQNTRQLAQHLWLPDAVENDLRYIADEFEKGSWDRLLSNRILAMLGEAIATCLADIRDLMTDRLVANAPFAESLATRIYVTQRFEGNYRKALDMLCHAKVALGRAVSRPWKIVNTDVHEFPDGGRLLLDASDLTIVLQEESKRTPLLQTEGLSEEEIRYVSSCLSDPGFTGSIVYSRSLAEGLLQTEIEPMPAWGLWREAMVQVQRELLYALSSFGHQANPLDKEPAADPDKAEEIERQMDELVPRMAPSIDWQWSDLDAWADLLGPDVHREVGQALKQIP